MDHYGPSGIAAALGGMNGAAQFGMQPGVQNFAQAYPLDRLIRKEVSLGSIREIGPPEDHIGLKYFPFHAVQTDDFIFNYLKGDSQGGLAPARAQDAESELAQKDLFLSGSGRGAVIDWAIKDHYDATDILTYRQLEAVKAQIQEGAPLPTLLAGTAAAEFPNILARDADRRMRFLHNRIEHMIWTSVIENQYSYNDGKVNFVQPWGRPADQTNQAPESGPYTGTTHNPIKDWLHVDEFMYERHGVNIKRAIMSRKLANRMVNSEYFTARAGLITQPGSTPVDLNYLLDGWGPQAALNAVTGATGISVEINDSVYRTRPLGSTVHTNQRFIPEDVIVFLPDESQIAQYDSSPLGLGKVVTSPHAEGNFQPGFYEWEQNTVDPWGTSRGTGIKAFPIFPHMELTYTMKVEL